MSAPVNWNTWLFETRHIENVVWAHMDAFEKRFAHGQEVISLRLSSEHIDFVFLTRDGAHIVDSIKIADLMSFVNEVANE